MGVVTETGYTLPALDEPLTHARILHERNRFAVKEITTSSEVAGFEASAVDNPLTYDAWQPFSNIIPTDTAFDDWFFFNATLGSDNQTVTAGTGAFTSSMSESPLAFSGNEMIFAAKVRRLTAAGLRLQFDDGTSTSEASFDLRDGTVSGTTATDATITDLGGGEYMLKIAATPLATASGIVRITITDGDTTPLNPVAGETYQLKQAILHDSAAWLRLDAFRAQAGDTMAVAAHNLADSGAVIEFQHDSDADGSFTAIETVTPDDNSPIFLIHQPVTSAAWRILVQRGALPKIGVLRVGAALQMQRPIYGGHAPINLQRETTLRSNYSETGEFLGRSVQRSHLSTTYQWNLLTADWVRANWPDLQRAVEADPFFIAWRPGSFSDAAYCQTDGVPLPSNTGQRDFMSVSLRVRGLGYD